MPPRKCLTSPRPRSPLIVPRWEICALPRAAHLLRPHSADQGHFQGRRAAFRHKKKFQETTQIKSSMPRANADSTKPNATSCIATSACSLKLGLCRNPCTRAHHLLALFHGLVHACYRNNGSWLFPSSIFGKSWRLSLR